MTQISVASTQLLADHYHGPGGWWPIFPIFWLLAFLTVFLVVSRLGWGRRRCAPGGEWQAGSASAESKLAERFAAGEIDEQEYRSRLTVLKDAAGRGEKR